MAEKYHNITVEGHPDTQIPNRLFVLRDWMDNPDMSQIYMFGTTSYRGNFGNPCFCLGPRDISIEQIDIGGLIEENLHAFYDYDATDEDIRQILGLVREAELSDDQREYEEFSYVDKGWCIDGLVQSFERIDIPVELDPSPYVRFQCHLLSHLKADCDYYLGSLLEHGFDMVVAQCHLSGNVEDHIAKMRIIYDQLPAKPEWLSRNDINTYETRMLAVRDGASTEERKAEPASLSSRASVAKEASHKLNNHDTNNERYHDTNVR